MTRSEMLAAPLPRLAISLGGAGQVCLFRKTSVEALTLPSPHDEAKLARDIVPICDDDPSDVRQAYRQFVPPVVELFNGEEVFEDFFHQYVYASFGSDDVESGAARKTLEKKVVNTIFYELEDTETYTLSSLSRLGEITTEDLEDSRCIKLTVNSSKCYLSYCTVSMLGSNTGPIILLQDSFNRELCEKILYSVYHHHIDGAHVKGNLLFQVNFSREMYNDESICTDMCANGRWLF